MIDAMKRQCQTLLWTLAAPLAAYPAAGAGYSVELGTGVLRQEGYLQTPAGGAPGTASPKRPRLSEIDLDRGHYRWIAGSADFPKSAQVSIAGSPLHFRLHARYTAIGAAAGATLASGFGIRGGTFAAGDSVRSSLSMDTLSLALTGILEFGDGVSWGLGASVDWTAFDFALVGEHHQADRAYHVASAGIVGTLDKDFGNGWRIGATLRLSPGFEGTGSRYVLAPRIARDANERVALVLATRFEEFRYDDAHKQALPNRLKASRALPTISVTMRFW